jgi:hypothetical protein
MDPGGESNFAPIAQELTPMLVAKKKESQPLIRHLLHAAPPNTQNDAQ